MKEKLGYYKEMVSGPGKFEGEASYVPYFWELYLEGCADGDDGEVLRFEVTKDDRRIFPELKGRRSVRLFESSEGFVVEVSP